MMLKDTSHRYGALSQCLHWSSAILVIALFSIGLWMVGLGYYDNYYHQAPALHISLGILLFGLTLVRIFWRLSQASPQAIVGTSKWQHQLALTIKWLLLSLLTLLAITGYLITSAEGAGASFFDWFTIPSSIQLSSANVDSAGELHEWGAWLLIALAVLHAGAAFMHHFIKKDETLTRMLPFTKSHNRDT